MKRSAGGGLPEREVCEWWVILGSGGSARGGPPSGGDGESRALVARRAWVTMGAGSAHRQRAQVNADRTWK